MSQVIRFLQDESGAVTVDWVVLTAAVVGLGIAVITAVNGGVGGLGAGIGNALSSASIDSSDFSLVIGNSGSGDSGDGDG
jgi:Flp pilus assembly pilin Flp